MDDDHLDDFGDHGGEQAGFARLFAVFKVMMVLLVLGFGWLVTLLF